MKKINVELRRDGCTVYAKVLYCDNDLISIGKGIIDIISSPCGKYHIKSFNVVEVTSDTLYIFGYNPSMRPQEDRFTLDTEKEAKDYIFNIQALIDKVNEGCDVEEEDIKYNSKEALKQMLDGHTVARTSNDHRYMIDNFNLMVSINNSEWKVSVSHLENFLSWDAEYTICQPNEITENEALIALMEGKILNSKHNETNLFIKDNRLCTKNEEAEWPSTIEFNTLYNSLWYIN